MDMQKTAEVAIDYDAFPPIQREFERKVSDVLDSSPGVIDQARDILKPANGSGVEIVEITPGIAAAIYRHFNTHNRELSIAKAKEYAAAMVRGEWKLNHQGMAAYPSGTLADGQHRCCAIVLSGNSQRVTMYCGLEQHAADTIDLSKSRNAGDALQLAGIDKGKIKAAIARTVMEYRHESTEMIKPKLSVIQVEQWVLANDGPLSSALAIG